MTISPVIRWCAVTYLLMAILAASTFSSPVTQRKKKMCGKDLPKSIAEVCEIYEDFFSPTEPREAENNSLTKVCCEEGCTPEYLTSYCRVVRNQTFTTELDSLGSNPTSTPQSVIGETETIAPTDPPNHPEIAYDGEYSDLEPLTLLPTYTSPEYGNDLLVFRS